MLTKLIKLAQQMIPVILGVLIGLLINGWKESYDEKKYLQKALDSIERDMLSSRESLVGVLDSQEVVMDTLFAYMEDDTVTVLDVFYKTGGLQAPLIKDIAIDFFTNDRGDLIDYELISAFAELKGGKDLMNEKFDRLTDYVNENMYETNYQTKEKTAILLADVIGTEEDLVDSYNIYFAKQEGEKPKDEIGKMEDLDSIEHKE